MLENACQVCSVGLRWRDLRYCMNTATGGWALLKGIISCWFPLYNVPDSIAHHQKSFDYSWSKVTPRKYSQHRTLARRGHCHMRCHPGLRWWFRCWSRSRWNDFECYAAAIPPCYTMRFCKPTIRYSTGNQYNVGESICWRQTKVSDSHCFRYTFSKVQYPCTSGYAMSRMPAALRHEYLILLTFVDR